MAGFVASAVARGEYPQVYAEDLGTDARTLIDVRTPREFAEGAIPGARNIQVDELRDRLGELPYDRPFTVYCQAGLRGYVATRILRQHGFDVANLAGGYRTYRMHQDARPTGSTPGHSGS
ncbi:MAG: rhodanese-like domain-containing protein [Isosphaeraceae bacterium]